MGTPDSVPPFIQGLVSVTFYCVQFFFFYEEVVNPIGLIPQVTPANSTQMWILGKFGAISNTIHKEDVHLILK